MNDLRRLIAYTVGTATNPRCNRQGGDLLCRLGGRSRGSELDYISMRL